MGPSFDFLPLPIREVRLADRSDMCHPNNLNPCRNGVQRARHVLDSSRVGRQIVKHEGCIIPFRPLRETIPASWDTDLEARGASSLVDDDLVGVPTATGRRSDSNYSNFGNNNGLSNPILAHTEACDLT